MVMSKGRSTYSGKKKKKTKSISHILDKVAQTNINSRKKIYVPKPKSSYFNTYLLSREGRWNKW